MTHFFMYTDPLMCIKRLKFVTGVVPKDRSSSSSSESAADGAPTLLDGDSVAVDPESRSPGNGREDARGLCSGGEGLSRPTRSIRISDWFLLSVPFRWRKKKHQH